MSDRSDRGYLLLDALFALFVLIVGLSGVAGSFVALNRATSRYSHRVLETIEHENRSGNWFHYGEP